MCLMEFVCSNHAELQASSQVKAVSDRENRNNERLNACLVKESSHTRADVQEVATDIQYTIYLTTDDISLKKDMKSPINVAGNLEDAHKELPGPSITAETTVVTTANEGHCAVSAVQVNTTQSGTSGRCIVLAIQRTTATSFPGSLFSLRERGGTKRDPGNKVENDGRVVMAISPYV